MKKKTINISIDEYILNELRKIAQVNKTSISKLLVGSVMEKFNIEPVVYNEKAEHIKKFVSKTKIKPFMSKNEYYNLYKTFCLNHNIKPVSRNTFYKYLNQIKGKTND